MIFHKQVGNGTKIVVGIHGWGGSVGTFLPLEDKIPESHMMINFDLPGYGKSTKPNHWNLESIIDDLALELENLGHNTVDILGNCSGALMAILLSQSPKLNVNNLYLIDPFAESPWYFRIFINRLIGSYAYSITFQNPLGRIITNLSLIKNRQEDTDMTSSFRDIDKETSISYLRMLISLEGSSAMENINCKPTIINGKNTFKTAKQSVKYYQSIWPNLNQIILPDIGHLPLEENPQEISRIVFDSS
jgi:pimeloyl-ACP methyl ester carboxylesterase